MKSLDIDRRVVPGISETSSDHYIIVDSTTCYYSTHVEWSTCFLSGVTAMNSRGEVFVTKRSNNPFQYVWDEFFHNKCTHNWLWLINTEVDLSVTHIWHLQWLWSRIHVHNYVPILPYIGCAPFIQPATTDLHFASRPCKSLRTWTKNETQHFYFYFSSFRTW